ncbi:PP2C family protein-serine/threonine phosphatase [Streptomyces sp. NPDC001262]|uniref:PP2C family protein-serine/threonine phosphatase n=1 Tax=unclassified Streptomyces TaxID=2593676 RepID=UPI0036BD1CF6
MKPDTYRGGVAEAPPLPLPARTLVAAAYALLATGVVTDVASNPRSTISPALATAPVLAGIGTRRARVPLAAGAVAMLIVAWLAKADPGVPFAVHLTSGVTVLAITCISTANVVLVATRERELLQSRSVAEAAQLALLRPVPERTGRLRVAVRYLAAAADARVGGDLYEVLATPFGTRLIVGDVRGKGLAAVETASDVLGSFREAAQVEPDLAVVAQRLDATVQRRGAGEEFVTAALVGVADSGNLAELVDCGHLPPLLLHAGTVTPVEPALPESDPPLGLCDLTGSEYHRREFTLVHGATLLLYTDGATEARDTTGRFYPLEERVAGMPESSPEVLLDRLVADLLAWSGGELSDDAALLAFRREK